MSELLRILALGPLQIVREGQPIPEAEWRSRQERRLLEILISARGRVVPTDQLIEWLWPGTEPLASAVTLRSAISTLRRTLEPGGAARASSRYVLTQPGGYAWNPTSGAWIDVDAFLDAHQRGMADESGPPEERERALRHMLELYRGDYLEDSPDQIWADSLRERLRERFLQGLRALVDLLIEHGNYQDAITTARHGLRYDPLREPLYRSMMLGYALIGDTAGALQSYDDLRRLLDHELGATPAAQTQALHTAILRGEVPVLPPRTAPSPERAVPTPPENPGSALGRQTGRAVGHPPLVGRAPELAQIRARLADLRAHHGGTLVIVGEAGIGKTRLAAEALRLAITQGIQAITLRCTLTDQGLPFAPLSEALRPLVRTSPEATLRRMPAAALAQAADLLPVLRERLPDLLTLPTAPPAESRNRQIDGLVDLALALCADVPLLVCCDDAQWADEATLAVLGRLARRAPRQPLLLLVIYRSEELVDNHALHTLLRSLGREMLTSTLVLARLEQQDVACLLADLARTDPERVALLAARLTEESGGNPLFLNVAVRLLLETHGVETLAALLPNLQERTPIPSPASAQPIRDLVLGRLDRLPQPARELLEQIALINRPVSLDLIERLGGETALNAARMLLERQFLVETTDDRLGFSHELMRSVIAETIAAPGRRLLHRRAAEALASLYGETPDLAADLAFHYRQAGHGAERDVLRYATAAGDQARRAFGYSAALAQYEVALRAAERLGTQAPIEDLRRAFVGRLRTCEALLDWDGINTTLTRYERWNADRPGSTPLIAPRRLMLLRALMGDLAGAAALGEAGARERGQSHTLADMLRRTTAILHPAGPLPDQPTPLPYAEVPFQAARPIPGHPTAKLPAVLGAEDAALALFQVGWVALMQGLLRDAEPCLLRAYELAGETGQPAAAVISALQLAHLDALRGTRGGVERWLNTSLTLAERAPEAAWASIWPRIHQAYLLLLDDNYTAARERFIQMDRHLHGLSSFETHRASVAAGQGLAELALGNLDEAEQHLRRALSSSQLVYGFVYVAACHGSARIAALSGNLGRARTILRHTLAYSATRSLLPEYVRSAIEIARIERDFGQPYLIYGLLTSAAECAATAGLTPLANAARALRARLGDDSPTV